MRMEITYDSKNTFFTEDENTHLEELIDKHFSEKIYSYNFTKKYHNNTFTFTNFKSII